MGSVNTSYEPGLRVTELMFQRVLVANRGAVAARLLRALNELGIESVAVYSEADKDAEYLNEADEAIHIGPAPAQESYLDRSAILGAMERTQSDALHPGYGFLSENADFATEVIQHGRAFIGPSPEWLRKMGHKTNARRFAASLGLPTSNGSEVLGNDPSEWTAIASRIGFPLLVKPAGGGGGIGMIRIDQSEDLVPGIEKSRSMAARSFANSEIYLERYFEKPRHIEFQLVADRYGNAMHLFERDCSLQRRHQKVIEEAPAPGIDRSIIEALGQRIADSFSAAGYDNIGTVEMLYGADGSFNFLEMNTRLQVEHGVTEEALGVDIVQAQIRLAAGERLSDVFPESPKLRRYSVEARVYAEDSKRFLPSPGQLKVFRPPEGNDIRVETGYSEGRAVSMYYDPLLAKVIASGATRIEALNNLSSALATFEIEGVRTNIDAIHKVLSDERFRAGALHTDLFYNCVNGTA